MSRRRWSSSKWEKNESEYSASSSPRYFCPSFIISYFFLRFDRLTYNSEWKYFFLLCLGQILWLNFFSLSSKTCFVPAMLKQVRDLHDEDGILSTIEFGKGTTQLGDMFSLYGAARDHFYVWIVLYREWEVFCVRQSILRAHKNWK